MIAGYPNLREIVWLQEEPRNMGAWTYMSIRIREKLEWKGALLYRGRAEAASPAEGSKIWHSVEQARILHSALEAVPPIPEHLPEHQEDLPGLLEQREEVATK